MLLQSIELENFRQFKKESIEFSTDPDRNVTLIIGDNGTGKTTFAQAFFWCLYGDTSFSDKVMLNRFTAEKMTPDEKVTVKVVLKLLYGSASYEIIRTQDYKKTYSNKIIQSNTVLSIGRRSEDGTFKYLKPLECESEIKKILPKELSGYFFFDGERVEKMSKEIASGRKSSEFSEAVIGLTGLKGMQSALAHLKPTSGTSANTVMGRFNAMYSAGSDNEIRRLTEDINVLQNDLDKIDDRLNEIEDEIETARNSKAKFEEDIKQFADGEKLQNEREKKIGEKLDAQKMRSQFVRNITRSFNKDMTSFFALSLVKKAIESLSKSDFGGKDIPEMHSKTIQYLLNRKMCICGTHLDPGTVPYLKVMELMEYLPPQSIGVTVGQYLKDSRLRYNRDIDLFQRVEEQLTLISQEEDTILDLQHDIDVISEKLDGNDVREQVNKLNAQIKACSSIISQRENERKEKLQTQGQKTEQKKQKENRRAELSLQNKNNRQIEIFKAYTQKIYDELYEEYHKRESEVRVELENSINDIFKSIYDGGLSITIDDKYNISVYVNDYEGGVETSTAQSISVIFAFISAIIKMAKENQRAAGDVSYAEPYPLVMDAPLSAFDKRRIKAVCNAIPETAEQVIIFIKDTDGELAEEHLGTKVKTRHYLEKIDEFHTKLI